MNSKGNISFKSAIFIAGLPLAILLTSVFIALSPILQKHPEVAAGVVYDLVLLMPVVYFLMIRKKSIPKISVVPVFVIGVITANVLLAGQADFHLGIVKFIIAPLVELTVVALIIYTTIKAASTYEEVKTDTDDFYSTMKKTAGTVLKSQRIGNVFATEIAMFYFSLIKWRERNKEGFSVVKKSGMGALYIAILMVVCIETFAIHILLLDWNAVVTWVITILSIYSTLQILGHLKSLYFRRVQISDDGLILRFGIAADCIIPYDQIESIEISKKDFTSYPENTQKLALLGKMEPHNIHIKLKSPAKIEKLYGLTKETDSLLMWIDEKDEFVAQVNLRIV